MKFFLIILTLFVFSNGYAVENYKDIYIDREQDIIIHGILCGTNIKQLRAFKPSYVFTNTNSINKGTYYYNSPYGNYSLTFNNTKNAAIMARGLLKKGQTKKEQMVKNICLVSSINGLPSAITKHLTKKVLKTNDADWDKQMEKYSFVSGKPAYGANTFVDSRSTAKFDLADKNIMDTNQAYLKAAASIFSQKVEAESVTLLKDLEQAIRYANQENGAPAQKTYSKIKQPTVWTPTSKERYNDLVRQKNQRKDWDKLMQKNFDWFFSVVGLNNALVSTDVAKIHNSQWNGQTLEQLVTIQALFEQGQRLELDFLMTSKSFSSALFDSMETIKKKSYLVRNNPIASAKTARVAVALPIAKNISLKSPAKRTEFFFSPFRDGKDYRYQ